MWVGQSDGSVLRIDPSSHETLQTSVDGTISDIWVGHREVWASTSEGDLFVIDPSGRTPPLRIQVGGTPRALTIGNGRVWVVDSINGVLTVLDEETKEVREAVPVGTSPSDIAFGLGAV